MNLVKKTNDCLEVKIGNSIWKLPKEHVKFYKENFITKNGIQILYQYPNKFGASIIFHEYSYGYYKNLVELAVTYNGKLCYSTPLTDNVLGYLNELELKKYLKKIQKLTENDL